MSLEVKNSSAAYGGVFVFDFATVNPPPVEPVVFW